MSRKNEQAEGVFERLADYMSQTIGRPGAFILALAVVAMWGATGPFADFSDTWQLIINTGTTIVTFLMVFLLGNASNRITESQDRLLADIYNEERRLEEEEQMIKKLLDRIDINHIRPIQKHLDEQDHQLESVAERILVRLGSEDRN